jgi:hypothetical protein
VHASFKIREKETPEIIGLLELVTLGTNGAQYRHLDTAERIKEADNPLFLSMERNNNVISNVTFCRRANHWYVRYFAFSLKFQSTGVKKSKGTSLLKKELGDYFQSSLDGENERGNVDSFYAYIDPKNEKSLWMSQTFGFETVGEIATQTFSRVNPEASLRVHKSEDWSEVKELVESRFKNYHYFFSEQTSKPPFYLIKDENGEIIAFAKGSISTWEIKRLPGKAGGLLTKIIPFIPGFNRLIRPKRNVCVVPEAVIVKDNNPELLAELFQGILKLENKNLILWWTDVNDNLYSKVKDEVKWGLLHKVIGVSKANIVQRSNTKSTSKQPFYTSGFDFI